MGYNSINIILSTYNSIDDILLNVDIYKHNFKHKYNLIACINNEDCLSKIKELDIVDSAIMGTNIPLDGSYRYARLHSRVYDSIKNGFIESSKFKANYSIHNHADALILKENSITSIINQLERKNKMAAVRGRGFGWYYKFSPIGMIDDHFLVFNNKLIEEKLIFQHESMELLPTRNNIHGILAMMILSNIGLKNTIFHSDINKLKSWDGTFVNMKGNYMRPMSIDIEQGFLHINHKSFLKNHSKQLLAHYLYSHNLTKGKYIEYILDTFYISFDELQKELKELENIQNNSLKKYLFDSSDSREFVYKDKLLRNADFKFAIKNIFNRLNKYLKNKICESHSYDDKIYYESLREKDLKEYYDYHFADIKEHTKFIVENNIK